MKEAISHVVLLDVVCVRLSYRYPLWFLEYLKNFHENFALSTANAQVIAFTSHSATGFHVCLVFILTGCVLSFSAPLPPSKSGRETIFLLTSRARWARQRRHPASLLSSRLPLHQAFRSSQLMPRLQEVKVSLLSQPHRSLLPCHLLLLQLCRRQNQLCHRQPLQSASLDPNLRQRVQSRLLRPGTLLFARLSSENNNVASSLS